VNDNPYGSHGDYLLDSANDWETSQETLADRNLAQVIHDGETDHDGAEPYGQVGTRQASDGLRNMSRDLARRHKVSLSTFNRFTTKHGSARLIADHRMRSLSDTLRRVRADAMESGERAALRRLDQVHPFEFIGSEPCHTTLSVFWWVRGQLAEIADTCGIHMSKVAVIAILASIASLPNERGYKKVVLEELDGFWEHVRRREEILRLG
jgi:hypothetical protein